MQALHDTAGDNEPGIPAEVAQQAVQWWLTLRGAPVSARQRAAWQQWRAQSPEHEAAWQRIESVGRQMAGISLPLARATLAGPHAPRRRRSVQLLAGLVVAGGSFALLRQTPAWRAWAADEVAGLGEQRRLVLPDGGAVVLNTDSAINIRYGSAQRVVQLVRGEILVQTAADAQRRPFVVETALGRVRALGTRFTVRERAASVSVEVLQGAVELTPARAAQATQRLNAGEQGRFTALQAHSTGALDDAAGAWADGMLVAARMRLDDFLAELGRYRRGRLGCDPAVAHLRVSGAYPLADTDRVLAALTSALPVQVHFFSRYWVMVRPA
ncbi:MAG: FecR domain-containing protein [Comamonas sp.]